MRLSQQLWNINWADHVPARLASSNLVVSEVSHEQATAFLRRANAHVFGEQGPWAAQRQREDPAAKQKYFEVACDAFGFWDDESLIGLFIGNPTDWSSYYMRWLCVAPEFQKKRVSTEFLQMLFRILRAAGVARVECETAPNNTAGTAGLTSLGFRVAGMSLSERWGALTRLYKHLDEQAEGAFVEAFCSASRAA